MEEKEKQLAIFEKSIGVKNIPYIALGGGKGGVGKTFLTYLFAKQLSKKGKVLVLDADIGLPNFYILSNVKPSKYLEDYFEGKATLDEIVTAVDEKIDLISPKSGTDYLLNMSYHHAFDLLNKLDEFIVGNYDYFLIDLGAGISKVNQLIFSSVDYPVLVLNPSLMSIIDAYGVVKTVFINFGKKRYYAVVNKVKESREYTKAINVLNKSAKSLHGDIHIEGIGYIPEISEVGRGEIPKKIFRYADEILENLLKGFYKKERKEPQKGFWNKLASFFRKD
jgi:flagellar biosynthesis protein FlhG